MIPGIRIEIGGKEFVLPPLGLGGLKKTAELRSRYAEMSPDEQMDACIETFHAALQRNYPDFTLDEMKEQIHAWEVMELQKSLAALYEKSGIRRSTRPAGEPPGEAKKGGRRK